MAMAHDLYNTQQGGHEPCLLIAWLELQEGVCDERVALHEVDIGAVPTVHAPRPGRTLKDCSRLSQKRRPAAFISLSQRSTI